MQRVPHLSKNSAFDASNIDLINLLLPRVGHISRVLMETDVDVFMTLEPCISVVMT